MDNKARKRKTKTGDNHAKKYEKNGEKRTARLGKLINRRHLLKVLEKNDVGGIHADVKTPSSQEARDTHMCSQS